MRRRGTQSRSSKLCGLTSRRTRVEAEGLADELVSAGLSEQDAAKAGVGVYPAGSLDGLFFDVPLVPLYNSASLPMEPFSVNITTRGQRLPTGGKRLWPPTGGSHPVSSHSGVV